MEIELTQHACKVIAERGIEREWVVRTVEAPERWEQGEDGTRHFLACIPQREGRVLRVIVNPKARPPCVVAALFDGRVKGRAP